MQTTICTEKTIQTMDGAATITMDDGVNNRIHQMNLQKGAGGLKFHQAVCV